MKFAEALAALLETDDVRFVVVFEVEEGVANVSNLDAETVKRMLVSAIDAKEI